MGHSANIRASKRLRERRELKRTGCPILTRSPRGMTKHSVKRRSERAATVDFSFFPAAITNKVQRKQAIVSDAGEGLKSIIFPVDGVKFEIIAAMKGKKVIKIITVVNLDKSETNQNN